MKSYKIAKHIKGGVLARPIKGGALEFIPLSKLRVLDGGIVIKSKPRHRRLDRPFLNDGKINIHIKQW